MMVVTGGGVEVDGDLDNRACITDRQEARKERKDSRTLKKMYGEQLKKNPSMYFFYLSSTMSYVLFTLNNVPPPNDDELPKIRLKRITRRIST